MVTQDFKSKLTGLGFDRVLIEVSDYVADYIKENIPEFTCIDLADEKEFMLFHCFVYALNHKLFCYSEAINSVDSKMSHIEKSDISNLFPDLGSGINLYTYWVTASNIANSSVNDDTYNEYIVSDDCKSLFNITDTVKDILKQELHGSASNNSKLSRVLNELTSHPSLDQFNSLEETNMF